ncbi:hypothetical protein [Aquibacillus rhizosphaerae]|uniref:YtxH domain-containing protein n=1 Tax=Aquibacillus rhizosphaerae TaxID=3051431 RepID=A0ABT7LB93_9BACI|nr:hypothetical protein [Aquibacillus sp. LR5S19]MDL4841825.1 hypothetical protein [Aquibacillus sp. LR5S19]
MSNDSKFLKGIVIGAAVGGLATLLDRNTRTQVWNKLQTTCSSTSYYMKHPSEGVHFVRNGYEELSGSLSKAINSTVDVLVQLQEIIDAYGNVDEEENITVVKSSRIE